MTLESLSTTPRSDELIDKAFSRAARTGRAKQNKLETQQSMLQTASNILSNNLESVVAKWPNFGTIDPFYYELANAIVDVDEVRKSLSEVVQASRQIDNITHKYQPKLHEADADLARKRRKQAFARMANVIEGVEDNLLRIDEARDALKSLPDIRPDEPAIVIAGYLSVGKSSFVNDVTRTSSEIAHYPFTTKGVQIGHFSRDHIRYQVIGTSGLLSHPEDEHNDIERQTVSALEHLADAILFVADASGACGYPIESQLELRNAMKTRFEKRSIPVLTVCSKSNHSTNMDADIYISVETGENIEATLDAAVEVIGFGPDIPSSRNE